MSKQVATLIVGLLAFAEGRSDNINYLREADREDVLDEISHDTLDRIAHRLYASESENLSAYERLLKDDKRKKMDYLNSIRPDLLPENRNQPASAEDYDNSKDHHFDSHVERPHLHLQAAPVDQLDNVLRRTGQTHEKLS